jgi:hypothetical protein
VGLSNPWETCRQHPILRPPNVPIRGRGHGDVKRLRVIRNALERTDGLERIAHGLERIDSGAKILDA